VGGGQGETDGPEDGIEIFEDLVIPEAHYPISPRIQPGCPHLILLPLSSMLTAIQLDNQSMLRAEEVNDVKSDWHLPPKLGTGDLSAAEL
jgi:hypothetical protein